MRQRRGRRERGAPPDGPNPGQPAAQPQPVNSAEPATRPDLPAIPPGPEPAAYGPPAPGYSPSAPQQHYDARPPDPSWSRYDSPQPADSWRYGPQQPAGPWQHHGGWGPEYEQQQRWAETGQPWAEPQWEQRPPPQPWQPGERPPRDYRGPFDPPRQYELRQPFEPPRYEPPRYEPPRYEPPRYEPWPSPGMPEYYEQPPPADQAQFNPAQFNQGQFNQGQFNQPQLNQPQLNEPQFGQGQLGPGQATQAQSGPAQPTPFTSETAQPRVKRRGRRRLAPGQAQQPPKRHRKRLVAIVTVVVVLVLGAGAAGGGYLLLRTLGSPGETASAYLTAWQRGDYRAMNRVTVNAPRGGLIGPLKRAASQLGVRRTSLTLGPIAISGDVAAAHFTVTDALASGHVWTYQGRLSLVVRKRHWWVNWSPSAIYPGLRVGERFSLSAQWPARAQILADDGTVLSSPATIAESGSIGLLVGYVGTATAADAKALGAPYRKGDQIGLSGIERTYQRQLAGLPSLTIKVVGPGKRVDATAVRFAARNGTPVRTSLNLSVQVAASQAVSSAKTSRPVDLVAISASTGRVLAVVERPGGFNRALQGIFPPGSTFKIVTASALAKTGLTPASPVQCPSQVTIDGRTFHNDKNEHYGSTDLLTAFAVSCNSTFALLATERLTGDSLGAMARAFGYNATPELGLPASLGHFTTPHDPVDLAADAFGQGTDLVNPLSQASEVAAIDSGVWRPPTLVISPMPHQQAKPHVLSPAIVGTLRPMMRAVVTVGTAAGVGFPPGVYGKTGTAEYLNGSKLASHGWFIGYQGDIAFAVLVEGGGYGADSAGPIANAFLRKL